MQINSAVVAGCTLNSHALEWLIYAKWVFAYLRTVQINVNDRCEATYEDSPVKKTITVSGT
jgi:hypothetical protein